MKQTAIVVVLVLFIMYSFAQTSKEFIPVKSVKLNGKLALENKVEVLEKELGPVTYEGTEEINCGTYFFQNEAPSLLFRIKGVEFEYCAYMVFVHTIDLIKSPNVFLTYAGGRLDRNTTLQQLRERFPQTAKKKNNTDKEFRVQPQKDSKNAWIFAFRDGKLIKITYHIHCEPL